MIPRTLAVALVEQGICTKRHLHHAKLLSGGDTCRAARIPLLTSDLFVKWSAISTVRRAMRAECDSLAILKQAGVNVPGGVVLVEAADVSALVMDFVPAVSWTRGHVDSLVQQLEALYTARLELALLPVEGTIGTVEVDHGAGETLPEWYMQYRILPLLQRSRPVLGDDLANRVVDWSYAHKDKLPSCLSWVHGDLWNGNVICGADGRVCLVDPVVHHAHHELDVAMMDLFGGFPPEVEVKLRSKGLLSEDWRSRLGLWQLIPALVHVAMFGQVYKGSVERIVISSGKIA